MNKKFTVIDPRYDLPYCGLADLPESHPALMRVGTVNGPAISELRFGESIAVKDRCTKHAMVLRVVRVK